MNYNLSGSLESLRRSSISQAPITVRVPAINGQLQRIQKNKEADPGFQSVAGTASAGEVSANVCEVK